MTAPTFPSPGSFGTDTPSVSTLYVDGAPAADLLDALNARVAVAGQRANAGRFWSTPARFQGDPQVDVLEVTLGSPKLINLLTFDLAHFPQVCEAQWWDGKKWQPFKDVRNMPVAITVTDSAPQVIGNTSYPTNDTHPQHTGPDHWLGQTVPVMPITASRLRLRLSRPAGFTGPINLRRQLVPYSLAVRGFVAGLQVLSPRDLPALPASADDPATTDTFASTSDILGSAISYSFRQNRADNLRFGGTWKSDPQPIPDAVVNLYLDARDASGNEQVVDRFYMEPLYSGAALNLYYSQDDPDGDFAAQNDPIPAALLTVHGDPGPKASATGVTFPTSVGYLDLDNQALNWRLDRPWWIGMVVKLGFAPGDANTHTLLDFGAGSLVIDSGNLLVQAGDAVAAITPPPWTNTGPVAIFAGYDGTNLTVRWRPDTAEGTPWAQGDYTEVVTDGEQPTVLRFGGTRGDAPGLGQYTLQAFVLKQEAAPGGDPEVFATQPHQFNDALGMATDTRRNALLRMLPSYISGASNPMGFVGGEGDHFGLLTWTPINRDYHLAKGYLELPPTRAKWFKFEFSSLTAAPYDSVVPLTRTVKVISDTVRTAHAAPSAAWGTGGHTTGTATTRGTWGTNPPPPSKGGAGTVVQQGLAAQMRYADDPGSPPTIAPTAQQGYTPTEAVYAANPVVNQQMRAASYLYGMQHWQGTWGTPRTQTIAQHSYETIEVTHRNKVAFFTGISKLTMYRLSYVAPDDNPEYVELLHDQENLAAPPAQPLLGWTFTPGMLSTPDDAAINDVYEQTSAIYQSSAYRRVRGIQFATTQTDPRQLLPDPDFTDPFLSYWQAVGDAQPLMVNTDFNSALGSTVAVTRQGDQRTWDNLEGQTWDSIEAQGLTWDEISAVPDTDLWGGIAHAAYVQPSAAGRLYAAVRVAVGEALTSPLIIQVIGADGEVLAESRVNPAPGQVGEYFIGYTIGESANRQTNTWDAITAKYPTWDALEGTAWADLDTRLPGLAQQVTVQVIQEGPSTDTWQVDNISIFDDPIVWEFSNDGGATFYPAPGIRNNPHGVFIFPEQGAGAVDNALVWRVRGYGGGLAVTSVVVRPWYGDLLSGILPNEPAQYGGPNLSAYDHFPPVEADPYFKTWFRPIPASWWLFNRQYIALQQPVSVPTAISGFIAAPQTMVDAPDIAATSPLPGSNITTPIVLTDNLVVPSPALPTSGGGGIRPPATGHVAHTSITDELVVPEPGSTGGGGGTPPPPPTSYDLGSPSTTTFDASLDAGIPSTTTFDSTIDGGGPT